MDATRRLSPTHARARSWPDYAAIWRWHFYAGLFCVPFICWLALTGAVYIFRPDIEAWLDRPYEALVLRGPRQAPSAEARAAIAAVPGSVFDRYQLPATPTGAAQVMVARDGHVYRVWVRPDTLRPMKLQREDHRPMELVSRLHGELLLGDRGSMLVELAASWAIVMTLTGYCLWFPRGRLRAAGLLYPRLRGRGRTLWRDLHAVTGFWVSIATLFLLLSGLPWASNWGNYLSWARNLWSVTAGTPDWPVGATDQPATLVAAPPVLPRAMPGMTAAEMAAMAPPAGKTTGPLPPTGQDPRPLDEVVPVARDLRVPPPVWVSPPPRGTGNWLVASQVQDRPLRVTYKVDPASGAVVGRSGFAGENVVDRVVNVVIATHEGHLFGRINQALLVLTAIALLTVSASAAVLWWRRRPAGTLGAPSPATRPRASGLLIAAVLVLAVLLPLFGVSLAVVLLADRLLLRRIPSARSFLGLAAPRT